MRILLVEDDVQLAATVRRGLQQEGHVVDVAHDGPEGEWLALEVAFDVLVLDVMLPGRSGEELCRRLRESGVWTPVLMLTARSGAEHEARALDTGADDFLGKPFSFDVLLARLRALVRRGSRERPTVLTVGDLTLDPAARTVHRGSAPVELTPRQFALLELFMRRPGEVLSKTDVLAAVWDFAYEGSPNIVEVYVHQLRRQIDHPFGRASLRTVRGAGYRLVSES